MPEAMAVPVPTAAEVLAAFLNTRHVELDREDIPSPTALRDWARQHRLGDGLGRLTTADVAAAQRLREALRDHLLTRPPAGSHSLADALAGEVTVGVAFSEGRPTLVARGRGWPLLRSRLLLLLTQVVAAGDWHRLKVCPGERCAWAFVDRSKNTARTWCSEQVCGARARSRAYRERRRRQS